MRLTRNMLGWCCLWLLLMPLLAARPAAVWTDAEASIVAAGSTSDGTLRRHPAEILARTALREEAAGGASNGAALAAAGPSEPALHAPSAAACQPHPDSAPGGFLACRTAHPRAPPA